MRKLFSIFTLIALAAPTTFAASPNIQVLLSEFVWPNPGAGIVVNLTPRDSAPPLLRGQTDSSGQITFSAVTPGNYFLQIENLAVPICNLTVPSSSSTIDVVTLISPPWTRKVPDYGKGIFNNLLAYESLQVGDHTITEGGGLPLWDNAAWPGGGGSGDTIWTNLPNATDMEGGTVYSIESINTLNNGTAQIGNNYLTNFIGRTSSGFSFGVNRTSPNNYLSNSVDVFLFGDVNTNDYSRATFNRVTHFFAGGNDTGEGSTLSYINNAYLIGNQVFTGTTTGTNSTGFFANDIYGFGDNVLSGATLLGTDDVYGFGNNTFSGAVLNSVQTIYGIGGTALAGVTLTNGSNIYAIGNLAGAGLSGTYSDIYLFGNFPVPTLTSGQMVLKSEDIRIDGPTTVTGTLTTGDPGAGTAAWKLGKVITGESGLALVTTNSVQVMIGTNLVKLAIVQ